MLSKPSVINIKKKMMAKNVDAGMLAMASAYAMKRSVGPGTDGREEKLTVQPRPRYWVQGSCPIPTMAWKGLNSVRHYIEM